MAKKESRCLSCKKIFYYETSKTRGLYCSNKCHWITMKGKIPKNLSIIQQQRKKDKIKLVCKICKKNFLVHLCHKKAKFCSHQCYSKSLEGKIGTTRGMKFPGRSGENHFNWIEDRTKLKRFNDNIKDRRSSAYKNWRLEVWKRDNWKCKINNSDCNGKIEAHHILSWRDYPELRYEINNGITLCHAHHPRKRAEENQLIPKFKELLINKR